MALLRTVDRGVRLKFLRLRAKVAELKRTAFVAVFAISTVDVVVVVPITVQDVVCRIRKINLDILATFFPLYHPTSASASASVD